MRIECPECKLTGNLDEAVIPATGIALNCPRCKARFTMERPSSGAAQGVAMLDTCPSCQYATFSDEKFSACPKCGLVVADYQRQRAVSGNSRMPSAEPPPLTPEERRRDAEARRKYGLEDPGEKGVRRISPFFGDAGAPVPLRIAGWTTFAAAACLALYGARGWAEYLAQQQRGEAALQAGEAALVGFALFWRFGLAPLLMIAYALLMAIAANRFLCLQARAIRWLEIGGWSGMALGVLTELVDLAAWFARGSENATIGYYATGLMGNALMAILWLAPPFVLVEYLRSEQFNRLNGHFT